jgi:iron complex outermembrane receptor protein
MTTADRRVRDLLAAGVTMAALAVTSAATAQVLEEIIVTAQKREQELSDVGISVTAFTGDQIRELGMTNTVDIVTMTPGLHYTVPNAEGSQINFFLRGVGLNEASDFNENPVAVYVDEVYRAAIGGLHFQMFDMERVEVLRGPQGTLFGRNTSGGLIQFVTAKPTREFEAYAQLTGGFFEGSNDAGNVESEVAVSGALGESLMGRASFSSNHHSGYAQNDFTGVDPRTGTTPDDFNESNALAGRLQLLWEPREDLSVHLRTSATDNHGQVGAWQNQPTGFPIVSGAPDFDNRVPLGPADVNSFCFDPGTGTFYDSGPGTDCFGYRDIDGDPHRGSFDRDGETTVTALGISGTIVWDVTPDLTITSISAFDTVDRTQEEDTDASPTDFLQVDFNADIDQVSQELRIAGSLERLRWTAGFYYFDWDVNGNYHLVIPNAFFFDVDATQDTESWAVFGQVEYDITPQFTGIVGVRYTEEEKELDYLMVDDAGTIAFLDMLGLTAFSGTPIRPTPDTAILFNTDSVGDFAIHDKSNISAVIELDWRPNDDWLIYGKFSRGVKSAGFNATFMDASLVFFSNVPETIPFGEETLHSWELGFKAKLFDGRARLNAAGFYYDYMDYQTFRFELLNSVIFNTDAEIYGGEIELTLNPWQGWDFLFGVSLLDATAKDVPTTATLVEVDRDPVAAPDLTLNGMARYEWPALGGTMAAVANFHYQDETFYDIQNYDISRADDYIVGNARLQWTSMDDRWQAAFFIENLADEEYVTYTFDFTGPGGFNQLHFGKPRWIGGSLRYTWR